MNGRPVQPGHAKVKLNHGKKSKSLLFVSDSSPNPGLASPVIFHRHLCRLEDEGWKINLLLPEADAQNYTGRASWRVKFLSGRLWWYPPFRPFGLLAAIRYEILMRSSSSFILGAAPDVIVGYLRGVYFSGFAACLSRRHELPLGYIYHDATELFPDMYRNTVVRERFKRFKAGMVKQASVIWVVSERMLSEEDVPDKMKLLYPLSEDVKVSHWPAWRKDLQTKPILIHAGTVYNETVEPLIRIAQAVAGLDGQLLFFTASQANAQRVADACPGTVVIHPAKPAADACEQIASSASALLVAYPRSVEEMPWIKSCFPSKFVQFTATGLPAFLLAPRDSALRIWAESHSYPGLLQGDSVDELKNHLAQLLSKESWTICAQKSRQLWQTDFDPDRIHRQFADDLERLAGC